MNDSISINLFLLYTRSDQKQLAVSSSTMSRIDRVYTDKDIANNTTINHKMISFTDNCNVISIKRLPSKTEVGKESWYFHNSLLCKPDFSSAPKDLLSLLKTQKNNYPSTSDWLEYTKSCFKGNPKRFSKNSTNQENISIFKLKERLRNL